MTLNNKPGNKNTPMRRCIGCMESKPKNTMIRIACYEGKLSLDTTGKAKGRGVYLCPTESCMNGAIKRRALQRSLGKDISQKDIEEIFKELAEYEGKDS